LFEHVQTFFIAYGKEQKLRLETDCKNNVNWTAAFDDSQRGLDRKFKNMKAQIMKPWTLSIETIPCNDDGIGGLIPDLHASNSTSQYNISRNGSFTRNCGKLLEMSEFAPNQSSIRDAAPGSEFSSTSDNFFDGNITGEGNCGRSFDTFGAEVSVGADRSRSGGNTISRKDPSARSSFNGGFERNLSPNSGVNLKRDFAAFSEASDHRGEWPQNGFGDSCQTLFPTPFHDKSLQLHNSSNRSPKLASVVFQIEHSLNEASNTPFIPETWPDASPVSISGLTFGRQPNLFDGMEHLTDSNFTQVFKLDTIVNRDNLPHGDPQHDHFGYPHTFSWH
jgi:hypothetical protein